MSAPDGPVPADQTPLARFYQFLALVQEFPGRFSFLLAITVALPVAALFTDFGPPRVASFLTVFTVVLQAAVIVSVYVLADHERGERLRAFALVGFLLFVITSMTYLGLWLQFVDQPPLGRDKVVKGFIFVSDEARKIYRETEREGTNPLSVADWDPAKYWTTSSITAVLVSLCVLWSGTFALLYAAITYILLYFSTSLPQGSTATQPSQPNPGTPDEKAAPT